MCGTIFTGAENTRRGRSGNGRSGAGRARNVPSRLRARGRGPRKQAPPGRRGSGRGRLRAAPGGAAARGFRPDGAGGARSPRPLRRACAVRPSHTPPPPTTPAAEASATPVSAPGARRAAKPGPDGVRIILRGVEAPLRRPPPCWRSLRVPSRAPEAKPRPRAKPHLRLPGP